VALACTGVALADGAAANQDLQAEIQSLKARLAELESKNGDNWLTEQRAEEVRNLVHDVLADADTRASLLQGGMMSGYEAGKGFYVSSNDGNYSVHMNGHLQTRFIYNNLDNGAGAADENVWGFENSRTKLIWWGNVGSPAWTYKIESNFSNSGGGLGLQDAWVRYDYGNGWGMRMGQFRLPLTRETLVYSAHQLAVERSESDYVYSGGFSQGIMADYAADQWKAWVAWSDGYGGTRSSFMNTPALATDSEFAVTGRFEYKAMGTWDQFTDFTSWAGDEQGLLIGAAGHWEKGEYGTAAANELETFQFTIDAQAEFGGSNLFGAFHYRDLDNDGGGVDAEQIGFVIQGGMMFADNWEGFVRYEWSDLDNFGGTTEDLSIVTFGVNKYFNGHNVKWTTDVLIGLDEIQVAASGGLTGTRVDAPTEDGQVAVRTQLQLWF
jgi:hypothetical protein